MMKSEISMKLTQKEKVARLQHAVINCSVEELSAIYKELGTVEMTAPALGLACRFRGLDMVKALVEQGAVFRFSSTRRIEQQYGCYIGRHYGNYRTNYFLYLLRAFDENLKGAFCFKGMTLTQCAEREAGDPLPVLSDAERIAVLRYLMKNKEKISFQPEEMLYYAIFFEDTAIVEELNRQNVEFLEIRVQTIVDGASAMNPYWLEYVTMTGQADNDAYLNIMRQIAEKLKGKQFHYTENIYEMTKRRFHNAEIFAFFLAHFKRDKMKKYQIIRGLIEVDAVESLMRVEQEGWLNAPKKRDEMIDYATQNGKAEALAWLLDYKNRTANFAVEQEKAEQKLMRELNAAPDSVTALKRLWSYRKREDGTLMITNYKGKETEVTVPKRIGKGVVTAIGKGAFSGTLYNPKVTDEQKMQHKEIIKVILPDTIQLIGEGAFSEMTSLKEINIPIGVQEIGAYAFKGSCSLKSLIIPATVEKIGKDAASYCNSLEKVSLGEGIKDIGQGAFWHCKNLREVRISQSVQWLSARVTACDLYHCEQCASAFECRYKNTKNTGRALLSIFEYRKKLTIIGPKGSPMETYCKEKHVRYKISDIDREDCAE